MRTLVLVPARAGSKRLPGKNLRLLGGKPLIGWTIEAALRAMPAEAVFVSTDSQQIAEVAKGFGAQVPFIRPSPLAEDSTSSVDVALHALAALGGTEKYQAVLLLQPTSPLRSHEDITAALQRFTSSKADALASMHRPSPAGHHVTVDANGVLTELNLPERIAKLNGAIYAIRSDVLVAARTFFPKGTIGFEMPVERSVDIDDQGDWDFAERLVS